MAKVKCIEKKSFILQLIYILAIGLSLLPLIPLMDNILHIKELGEYIIEYKSISLFIKSLLFCIKIAILDLISATILLSIIWRYGSTKPILLIGFLLSILLPPYISAEAWQEFWKLFDIEGVTATLLSEALIYLPLALGGIWLALSSFSTNSLEALLLESPHNRAFWIQIFRIITPFMTLIGILIIFLSLNDYATPLIFGEENYAIEIFSRFSAKGSTIQLALDSLPLLVISTIFIYILIKLDQDLKILENLKYSLKWQCTKSTIFKKLFSILIIILALSPLLIPISYWSMTASQIGTINIEIKTLIKTLILASISIIITIPFAWIVAQKLLIENNKKLLILIIWPLVLPVSLTAVLVNRLLNPYILDGVWSYIPLLYGWSLRSFPILVISIIWSLKRQNPQEWEVARLFSSGVKLWFNIRLYQISKAILGASLVSLLLILSSPEFDIILAPAGFNSFMVSVMNALHYGDDEAVAIAILILIIILWVIGATWIRLIDKSRNRNRYD